MVLNVRVVDAKGLLAKDADGKFAVIVSLVSELIQMN